MSVAKKKKKVQVCIIEKSGNISEEKWWLRTQRLVSKCLGSNSNHQSLFCCIHHLGEAT